MSHEPRIAELHDRLHAAGIHAFHVPSAIMLDEQRPASSRCIRCATCDGYPCLVQAKADAEVVCVRPALEHPNVTLLPNSEVIRHETSSSGRDVTRVIVRRGDTTESYEGDLVVEVAMELSRRLAGLFLSGEGGGRAFLGDLGLASDPHWSGLINFHEYFHAETGRGLGASHQTGWTALVVRCLEHLAQQRGAHRPEIP